MSKKIFFKGQNKKKKFYKKQRKVNVVTILTLQCTSNNTIIHAQCYGGINFLISAGTTGLKAAKRSTVYAAQQTANLLSDLLKEKQIDSVIIFFKGFNKSRKAIVRILKKKKIKILQMFNKTSITHNGCRQSKKRRL